MPASPLIRWLKQTSAAAEPGAAAGHGLGYTIQALLQGKCQDSVAALMSTIGFRERLRHADAGGGNIRNTERKCRRAEHGNSRLVGAERGGRQLLFSARPNGVL